MATTTTNFGWDIPQSTDLVKDGATAIAALGQDIDTAFVDLKGGTTGQVLAKASNTDLDYSWVAIDPLTILDAKGDLITATAADTPARLAVGTNGQVLTADSTTATGLKWNTASSGGVTLITDVQLSASSGYDWTSIPSTYKDLTLTFSGLQSTAVATNFALRFNSDSSANYLNYTQYQETGSAPSLNVGADTSVDAAFFGNQITSSTASNTARGSITIYDYASTTRTKVYVANVAHYSNNNGRVNFYTIIGNYNSTTAISSLNLVRLGTGGATVSNQTNTSIRLYGVS